MKIKRSEQELAYLEKREREVRLWWWAGSCLCFCTGGWWSQEDPPLMFQVSAGIHIGTRHQMPPKSELWAHSAQEPVGSSVTSKSRSRSSQKGLSVVLLCCMPALSSGLSGTQISI